VRTIANPRNGLHGHEPDDIGDHWEIIDERKNNTECRDEISCIFLL